MSGPAPGVLNVNPSTRIGCQFVLLKKAQGCIQGTCRVTLCYM
jgi:hypothetical protein